MQFDIYTKDFSPEEQALIGQIAGRLGISVPAGAIGDQLVDQAGNPINAPVGASQFGKLLGRVVGEGLPMEAILPTGNTYDMNALNGQATGTIVPSSGLSGAEQAIGAGTQSALAAIQAGNDIGRNDIMSGGQQAQNILTQNRDLLGQTAITARNLAEQPLQPFISGGQSAAEQQAALTGGQGVQAQQQAYDNYISSPGQQFLRDQAEQTLLRNNAAIGGLGGGRVRQELQNQAIGMAAQDFGNHFNRLSQVANQGAAAGGQLSSITGSLGNNLLNGVGANQNLAAQLASQQGVNLANNVQNNAAMGANLLSGAGMQIGQNRMQAGQMLANQLAAGNNQLANLQYNQGLNAGNYIGDVTSNISNLLGGTGAQVSSSQQQLAALLANIATGTGGQVAGLPSIPGVQMQNGNNVLEGAGRLLGAYESLL